MGQFFSVEDTVLNINGVTITGYSNAEDALDLGTIELAAVKRGADGGMTATTTGIKGAPLTIKLLPTSTSTIFLSTLAELQKQGTLTTLTGALVNTNTGVSVTLITGVFTSYVPYPTLGQGAVGDMEYIIEFQNTDSIWAAANF